MKIDFPKTCEINLIAYLLLFLFLIWGSGQLTGYIALKIYPELDIIFSDQEKGSSTDLLFALIISPLIETVMLAYCILISRQIIKNKNISLICAVLPVCALHALVFWQLALIALLPFFFQASAYVTLRERWPASTSIIAIAILHGMANFTTLYLSKSLP